MESFEAKELLYSNRPPSIADANIVKASIQDMMEAIEKNDEEIEATEILLKRLRGRSRDLADQLVAQQRILSPARHLPSEIISEIFIHCLPIPSIQFHAVGIQVPLRLGQLCRRWRDIALSTPALWTFIPLTLEGSTGNASQEFKLQIVKTWLDRSGELPLMIYIADASSSISVDSRAALSLILSQSDRWAEAQLMISGQILTEFEAIRGRLSTLRKLSVGSNHTLWNTKIDIFETAPLLRSLSRKAETDVFVFPYQNLTEYTCLGCSPQSVLKEIRVVPNLIEFTAAVLRGSRFKGDPILVHHHLLCNLTITIDSSVTHLFECLSLPSLQEVNITLRKDHSQKWASRTGFVLLLQSVAQPGLKSLTIRDIGMERCIASDDLTSCIEVTPLLTSLVLGQAMCRALTQRVLSQLTFTHQDILPLLPKLETLSIYLPAYDDRDDYPGHFLHTVVTSDMADPFSDVAFASFVGSRWVSSGTIRDDSHIACLRTVSLVVPPCNEYAAVDDTTRHRIPETFTTLLSVKAEGMDVMIRSSEC